MENVYFLVTNMSTWTDHDPRQFLDHYFIQNGAFTTCFLIALIVSFLGLLIFYGWIGMTSNRLSNQSVWIVTLVAVGLITLGTTQLTVVGSQDSQTGFFEDATQYAQELRPNESDASIDQFEQQLNNIREKMSNGCDVVYMLDFFNMGLSLVIFFLLSLGVKRFTRYAIAIPF